MDQDFDKEFEEQFELLWEKASLNQKILVASRAASRSLPALQVKSGFEFWKRSNVGHYLDGIHKCAVVSQIASLIERLEAASAYGAAASAAYNAAAAEAPAAAAYAAAYAAYATYADTEAAAAYASQGIDRSFRALRFQRPAMATHFQRILLIELDYLLGDPEHPNAKLMNVVESPLYHSLGDAEEIHEFVGWYCSALRMHDLNDLAYEFGNQAFNRVSINTLQEWALGKVVKEFPLRPAAPKWYEGDRTPPNKLEWVYRIHVDVKLDEPSWWPTFLYHLAISDRQHLPLLADPDPEKIAEVLDLLIQDKHPDCLSDLYASVKSKIDKSLESYSQKADDFQPPKVWLAWLNNIHQKRLAEIPKQVQRKLVGDGSKGGPGAAAGEGAS